MTDTAGELLLTGIKPTGEPHIGNYIGAIRPGIELARTSPAVYFVADFHALNSLHDPEKLRQYTRSVAATWIACGLDPARTPLYRQSDVPEIFELASLLANYTSKGLLNRAHAYKSAVEANRANGAEPDGGINIGLYVYPVLMAADILAMNASSVPVGFDQRQHVEIAADIAERFNSRNDQRFRFNVPRAFGLGNTLAEIPGTDGRKMSKSYGNTIPLFAPADEVTRICRRIVTDSTPVDEPKVAKEASVYNIFAAIAEPSDAAALAARLGAGGLGWGTVKAELAELLIEKFDPLRRRYDGLIAAGSELDDILESGAATARNRAGHVLAQVRSAIGID